MSESVRVRFAPSPTGFLHIGGVRTALFNYLYAKQKGGKFLIRIEDTDTERSEPRFTDDILNCLAWLGMKSDEEILYQSKRQDLYLQKANELIEKGFAYKCYSTEEEVDAMRALAEKEGRKPMYDRTWRESKQPAPDRPFAIRAKFPLAGTSSFDDLIKGTISVPNEDLDDFVLVRSNGVPTYNFVVVVDDLEMKISHVIRGDDHVNNTPKQMFLYNAFDAKPPLFAHLPMILGADKKKLSKRNGEVSTIAYKTAGYLPEALMNFLVRLGWSHGDQEVFSIDEMIQFFDFKHVQVSGAVFNPEKLLWLQGEHLRRVQSVRILKMVLSEFTPEWNEDSKKLLATSIGEGLLSFVQAKAKLLPDIAVQLAPLCRAEPVPVDASTLKWNKDPNMKTRVKEAIQTLRAELRSRCVEFGATKREESVWGKSPSLSDVGYHHSDIDQLLRAYCERFGIKIGDLTQPMRLFITGQATSAIGLFDLMPLMPWDWIDARLEECLKS